ncbi:EamA family transporter [Lichenihabitans psoromatis]|uniref:EamA family transporter n=1 Tax=Lichenihabitans psoromatis TaxID=2528642 RepID=UPI001036610B|nr:EamA family transporter [Lichenihabitans psoromatis]
MSLPIIGLVLLAAFMHAGWNALLRGGRDRLWSMAIMDLVLGAGGCIVVPFTGLPSAASLPYVIASGLLHFLYNILLVRSYRTGDLGEIYPIARGSSPALVTLGALVLVGEHPGVAAIAGVLLITGGILLLALAKGRLHAGSLPIALATGAAIASYTVVDGIGVRLSGDWLAYSGAMFALELLLPLWFVWRRGVAAVYAPAPEVLKSATGGAVSFAAYAVVIWALQMGAMGSVSALRETSVVFAAVLGRLFLGETLTGKRIAACLVIAIGAACIAQG